MDELRSLKRVDMSLSDLSLVHTAKETEYHSGVDFCTPKTSPIHFGHPRLCRQSAAEKGAISGFSHRLLKEGGR